MDERPHETPHGMSPVSDDERDAPRPQRRQRTSQVSAGSILGMAWTVFTQQVVPIMTITVVVMGPVTLLSYLLLGSATDGVREWENADTPADSAAALPLSAFGTIGVNYLLLWTAPLLLQGAVTWIAVRHLQGGSTSVGSALTIGLQRLVPTIGVVFAMVLIVAGLLVPAAVAAAFESFALAVIFGIVGLVAAIVLFYGYFCAIPACVIDKPGVWASLRRSWNLTKGYKGSIFLALFAVGLIKGVGAAVLLGVTGQFSAQFGEPAEPSIAAQFEINWVAQGVEIVFAGFIAVCAAVTYYQLRVRKEGVGIGDLAGVFD
jgi:hypothetical protein